MRQLIARFLGDETGATAIEYTMIAAGISIVIITVVNGIGTNVKGQITTVSSAVK
jgi:pilus assembly protein Flp/PilA